MPEFPLPFIAPSDTGAYETRVNHSPVLAHYFACEENVEGSWFFRGLVPDDFSSLTSFKVAYVANATSGATRLDVEAVGVADGETMDPASLTAVEAQTVAVPGTAYLLDVVTFDASLPTLAAGDLCIGRVFHDGDLAGDTLAVPTLLAAAWAVYAT